MECPQDDIFKDEERMTEMFESRISAGATEKLQTIIRGLTT